VIIWLVSLLGVLLSGCAFLSYPPNPKLTTYDSTVGYRFANLSSPRNSDSLFIILSFSGGGTRAAALSYGVLEKLRDTTIVWEGERRRLLDEVDVISSVSGGSFTAAYYGAFGDQVFERFAEVFLYRNIEQELKALLFSPINWIRLASPTFGRIELAAELYDREIFEGRTFHDLLRRGQRPFILLNATDIAMGVGFPFEQAQFDLLCSDLSGVTLAQAVAASSNFPVAFSPMTLNNYAGNCNFQPPLWIQQGEHDWQSNPARYHRARVARSYQDPRLRPYIHLLDGGVADNIGMRGPLLALGSNDPQWSVLDKIANQEIKKLVVIVVDAKTMPTVTFDQSARGPGLAAILEAIATAPMENYSFDTVELWREAFDAWRKEKLEYAQCEHILQERCPTQQMPFPPVQRPDPYGVYIGFDQIPDTAQRSYFQNMATSFYLPASQVDDLRQMAKTFLEQAQDFQRLVADLQ
jgi:NTE family protein